MKISKGIVITTSEYTYPFLQDCITSLGTKYPVLVVANNYDPEFEIDKDLKVEFIKNNWNGFELGGILRGKEYFDEFVHLMDTTIVKDTKLFDELFNKDGHVFLTRGMYHYMGKFVSKDLPDIPKIGTKGDAIALELNWLKKPHTYFEPDLPVHTDVFEEIYGQRRMRLENNYIIKWKGTWSL